MLSLIEIFSPIQLLAWGAGLLYFVSYQKQSANKTIMLWAPADFLFALHFYFMNAPFFLFTAVAGSLRSIIALKCKRKTLGFYLLFYAVALMGAFFFLEGGVKDFFGLIGSILFCLSIWFKDNFITHRLYAFGHQMCWIVAYIFLQSYGGFFFMSLIFLSNLVGTGRYLVNQQNRS